MSYKPMGTVDALRSLRREYKAIDDTDASEAWSPLEGTDLHAAMADAGVLNIIEDHELRFRRRKPSGSSMHVSEKQAKANQIRAEKAAILKRWGRTASTRSYYLFGSLGVLGFLVGALRWLPGDCKSPACKDQADALAWSAPLVCGAIIFIGVVFVGHEVGGIFKLFVGKNNQFSTSLVQIGLWTFAIAMAFMMFVVQIANGGLSTKTDGFHSFDETYLFLLGGPFAAAVLAKATAIVKSNDQTSQQTEAPQPSGKDLVSDSVGMTSLSDAQFLMFNLVALAYFAVGFAKNPTELPTIHPTLVGLTSASALAYVGGKVVNSNPPVISSISIISGGEKGKLKAGTQIRIIGQNFDITGDKDDSDIKPAVLFGNLEQLDVPLITNTEIHVSVPADLPSGNTPIAVRTSKGVASSSVSDLESV